MGVWAGPKFCPDVPVEAVARLPSDAIVACTMVQNELAYLPEWILFHNALGVDKFVIYNHRSDDGVEALEELFAPQNITVEVITRHDREQPKYFSECLRNNEDAAWVGIFDVD